MVKPCVCLFEIGSHSTALSVGSHSTARSAQTHALPPGWALRFCLSVTTTSWLTMSDLYDAITASRDREFIPAIVKEKREIGSRAPH